MNIKELMIKTISDIDFNEIIHQQLVEDKTKEIVDILTSDEFLTTIIKKVAVIFSIARSNQYNANDTEFIKWFNNYGFKSDILNEAKAIIAKQVK